jgi:diacylglycerol kinase family enzyme
VVRQTGGSQTTLLVVNPRAGSADPERVVEQLRRRLGAISVWTARGGNEPLYDVLRAEIEARQPSLVVASGGDGTVGAVATALADHDIPLGVVPSGTANLFAREVGIPPNIEDACGVIARRRVQAFDTLEIAGRRCLCRVGSGVFASVGHETLQEDKRNLGSLAYVRSALPHLVEHAQLMFELDIDGRTFATRGSGVVVTNLSTIGLGELRWGDTVRPDDGVADVFILHASRMSEKLSVLWNAIATQPDASTDVTHLVVREYITVRSTPPSEVVADGEFLPCGEYHIDLRPSSIAVCVP